MYIYNLVMWYIIIDEYLWFVYILYSEFVNKNGLVMLVVLWNI